MRSKDFTSEIYWSEEFGYGINRTPDTEKREFYSEALYGAIRERVDNSVEAEKICCLANLTSWALGEVAFRQGINFAITFILQAMTPHVPTSEEREGWKRDIEKVLGDGQQ